MVARTVVKSPTAVLEPLVLNSTSRLSPKAPKPVSVLVQNESVSPLLRVCVGVKRYSLTFPPNPAPLKLAAMYESAAPECDVKTAGTPWNQFVVPAELLLLV